MNEKIKEILKGIKINKDYLTKIKESKKTIQYLESEDFSKMPEKLREMNENLLIESKKIIENIKDDFIEFGTDDTGEDALEYAGEFPQLGKVEENISDLECYESILNKETINLTSRVRSEIEELLSKKKEEKISFQESLKQYIEETIRSEFIGVKKEVKQVNVVKTPEKKKPINYIVRKSNKSISEIKDIVIEFLKKNDVIFDRIIFENKGVTISITDRILDVYFKLGTGYVVNFISEPDTNYGKFYQNLLKVFSEIKEKIYMEHNIVVVPEDGKSLSYLNSFYQNYVFIKEKLDTILIQYKLQHSLLNENFSIKYLVFEKPSAKYLVYYTGNKQLVESVEQYIQNQAKLGTMPFEIEYVEYKDDINSHIKSRYEKRKNKIDLIDKSNTLAVTKLESSRLNESVLFDITGVKILIDPVEEYKNGDLDIIVLTDARKDKIYSIPKLIANNPGAKLFTSDITYKIARLKWLKEINTPALGNNEKINISKHEVDSVNEKVIRITPGGKGYNFKGLVNIKFFNSGCIPGSAAVEIRDSGNNCIYTGDYCCETTSLLKGGELDLASYDHLFFKTDHNEFDQLIPIHYKMIKDKLEDGKQVFIFTDYIGNLQHVLMDIARNENKHSVISGDNTFGVINKEISKLISYGSSWGDYIDNKELFQKSVQMIESFSDEYEFYKKFSTDTPQIFLIPFDKTEIEMIIKNKVFSNHLVLLPTERSVEYNKIFNETTSNMGIDDTEDYRAVEYNYIARTSPEEIIEKVKNSDKLVSIVDINDNLNTDNKKVLHLKENTNTKIY